MSTNPRISSFVSFAIFAFVCASGCRVKYPDDIVIVDSDHGGGAVTLHSPFAYGVEKMCTQGANGARSHTGVSTRFDIDLDTDNYSQEELFAPVSGVARVHMESATSGYGYHVNIDLGDGTYVVIAHCSEIFVSDEDEVAAGELIAYEGNTGDSTGDHVHIGLHQGDAARRAEYGESLPTFYYMANASNGGEAYSIASEDFSCGIASQGDARDGDFYESRLPTVLWHPDGTLVKSPDNARVYVVDEGRARWIENEDVFYAMGYSFGEVALVSREELECLGQGEDVIEPLSVPTYGSFREGDLLKETDTSDVYVAMDGHALPVKNWDTFLLMWFGHRTIIEVAPGEVEMSLQLGNCAADAWCLDAQAVTTCGGGLELVGDDGLGGEQDDDDAGDDDAAQDDDDVAQQDDDDGDDDATSSQDDDDFVSDDDTGDDDTYMGDDDDASPLPLGDCGGEDACIVDANQDGVVETLLMNDERWTTSAIWGDPAFIYGNGGCFDGLLSIFDLVFSQNGYYQIDFSGFAFDCQVTMTLISSVGVDGSPPDMFMNNWFWWQNAPFCSRGSPLCELMDNGMPWEEWLFALSWNPSTGGLEMFGNAYTDNSQL
jgi:murein DD-endopeptidase MepM/ murein hydrolase activator NlpD